MKHLLVCTGLLIAATTLLAQQPAAEGPPRARPLPETAKIGGENYHHHLQFAGGQRREGHIFTKMASSARIPHFPRVAPGAKCGHQAAHDADSK